MKFLVVVAPPSIYQEETPKEYNTQIYEIVQSRIAEVSSEEIE